MRIILLPTILTIGLMATFVAPKEGEIASIRQETSGDVYAASNAVIVAAPVHGDIFAAGDSVDISSTSDNSVFAIGRTITVSGAVQDDIRVVGSNVSLISATAHDVFAAGSSVFVGPEASVGGDAYIAGSDITIAGTIKGTLRVAGQRVTIAKTAVITGDVIAYQNKPAVEDGATITGNITTITPPMQPGHSGATSQIGSMVKSAVSSTLLALALIWIAPMFIKSVLAHAMATPTHAGLLGLAIIILFLPITLLLTVTSIGIHMAMLLFTGSLFCIVLGIGSSILLLGVWLEKLYTKKGISVIITWQHALIGGVAAAIISLAGGIGFLALFVLLLIGLGAVITTLKHLVYGR